MLLALVFTGCQKDIISTNLVLDNANRANLKVYFFAELDKTKLGLELVPNGTRVFISIPNSAFNPNATGIFIDSAVINNGLIQISVPTVNNGVTVTIRASEFTADQVQAFGSPTAKVSKIFSVSAAQTISIVTGESKTKEITYDSENTLDNFAETVNSSYILRADLDQTIVGDELVSQNTVINLYTGTWAGTATVTSTDGKITTTIPKGVAVTARFEATKILTPGPNKKYLYTATIPIQNVNTTFAQTVTFTGVLNEN